MMNDFDGKHTVMRFAVAMATASASVSVLASGFALQNQNGAGSGSAFAGQAAVAEDASTIFFNPAGMTRLPAGHSVSLAATALSRSLEFANNGTNPLGAFPAGGNGGDAGGTSLIPAGYYSYAVSPALRFGLGISAPFGNKTEWESMFAGRFQGSYSEIKSVNINPSVAYAVNDRLSLGFGVNWLELKADLRSVLPLAGEPLSKLDGKGDDWGYNFGLLWQLSPAMRLGLSYRSTVKVGLEGTATVPAPVPVRAEIKLPDTLSLSLHQRLSDRWEMMGDWTWTGWSSLPALTVMSRATGALISSEQLGFRDSWRLGFGGAYRYDDAWKVRFGIAYDRTPAPDMVARTVRLPDSDRWWFSVGARWQFAPRSSLDLGYTHIFFEDERINRPTLAGGLPTGQFVRGLFETSADLFSLQLNHSF